MASVQINNSFVSNTDINKNYSPKTYMKTKYEQYHQELKNHVNKIMPLYLYSFRVYLAYINEWKIINRDLLTKDEIDVMNQLGVYKYPKRYIGNRYMV
jgi:hypothetical protein